MVTLVTGANGFVGEALVRTLLQRGVHTRCVVRGHTSLKSKISASDAEIETVEEIGPDTDWTGTLSKVQTVIHLAARVHVMKESAADPLSEFKRINTFGTGRLATMAAKSGVRRLVYVSTIKVNGESTTDAPFCERDTPNPADPYAISKWEAEQLLSGIAKETGMEVTIVRPPLVYGPGVKGNFESLMRLIYKGVPLPVGRCHNLRSLLGLDNLVDLLVTCISHPAAAGETFVLSDGEDLSTAELIRRLATAMNRPARLMPIPLGLLRLATRMVGRPGLYQRLCGSLQVDSGYARRVLGWMPPQSVDAGLAITARTFLQQQGQ